MANNQNPDGPSWDHLMDKFSQASQYLAARESPRGDAGGFNRGERGTGRGRGRSRHRAGPGPGPGRDHMGPRSSNLAHPQQTPQNPHHPHFNPYHHNTPYEPPPLPVQQLEIPFTSSLPPPPTYFERPRTFHSNQPVQNSIRAPPFTDPHAFPPLGSLPPQSQRQAQNMSQPLDQQPTFWAQDFGGHLASPAHPLPAQPPHHFSDRSSQSSERGIGHPRRAHGHFNQHRNPSNPYRSGHHSGPGMRQNIAVQSEYLQDVILDSLKVQLTVAEQREKEAFRVELETAAQNMISEYTKGNPSINPKEVKLKCYGSLANGFGLPGSDLDLLLAFPTINVGFEKIKLESQRLFEKTLLDMGIGARLLTNTRVPILRVCQSPSKNLLHKLRQNRENWEKEQLESAASKEGVDHISEVPLPVYHKEITQVVSKEVELSEDPANIPLPQSPTREPLNLEFGGDLGIQCDINFSNYVAIHNTRLLRSYAQYDSRVKAIGVFVKRWAKARGINTPYHGTLSSYGYVLLVLHYLMNIANPPVIPNLQHLAREEDAWANKTEITLFEGFDIRFLSDEKKIAKAFQGAPKNQETLGALLRGFFHYYGSSNGFYWKNQVISIRTKGGILTKHSKDWTEGKWVEGSGPRNVRLRYLLAIEDPFETEHNIARTVGHNGLVAIRDEFRRACTILERVKHTSDGWQWQADGGGLGEDLLTPVTDRGDLLRKDQEFHQQKVKQMKDLVSQSQQLAIQDDKGETGEIKQGVESGMSMSSGPASTERASEPPWNTSGPNQQLTRTVGNFQDRRKISVGKVRVALEDSDDEEGLDEANPKAGKTNGSGYSKSASSAGGVERHSSSEVSDGRRSTPEPIPDYSEDPFLSRGLDGMGKPIPWSTSTQEERWLIWRDNKIRQGKWDGLVSDQWKALHLEYPFDARRPRPDSSLPENDALSRCPPWPMPAPPGVVVVEKSQHPEIRPSSNGKSLVQPASDNNPITAWDCRTWGGKFLLNRDLLVLRGIHRDGKLQSFTRLLSRRFPFNPNITEAELEASNEVLRRDFRHRNWYRNLNHQEVAKELLALKTKQKFQQPESESQASGEVFTSEDQSLDLSNDSKPEKIREGDVENVPDRSTLLSPTPHSYRSQKPESRQHEPSRDDDSTQSGWGIAKACTAEQRSNCLQDTTDIKTSLSGKEQYEKRTRLDSESLEFVRKQRLARFDAPKEASGLLPASSQTTVAKSGPVQPGDTVLRHSEEKEISQDDFLSLPAIPKVALPRDPPWKTDLVPHQQLGRFAQASESSEGGSSIPPLDNKYQKNGSLPIVRSRKPSEDESTLVTPKPRRVVIDERVTFVSPPALYNDEANGSRWQPLSPIPSARDIKSIMKDAGIGDTFRKDSAVSGLWTNNSLHGENASLVANAVALDVGSKSFGPEISSPAAGSPASASNSNPHASPPAFSPSLVSRSHRNIAVPATLYPGMTPSMRPRDENPDIMPIPRKLDFQFDPRQMRDLEVIADGGNGCARHGEEWKVEQEYELGGGGVMGWKKGSSTGRTPSGMHDGEDAAEEYAYGLGDSEGLLNELPLCGNRKG